MSDIKLDSDTIRNIIGEIETEENLIRKRRAWNSELIRTGKLRPFVEMKIKEMYPKTHSMYSVSDYSILAKVIGKKAQSYKESPIRKVANQETASDVYNKITKRYNLNQAMTALDTIYNENKYGLVAAMLDRDVQGPTSKAFWKFYALSPYEFDVIKNDDGEVECVIISYPQRSVTGSGDGKDARIAELGKADEKSDIRCYSFWTKTEHLIVNVSGKNKDAKNITVEIPDGGSGANPYGILPFVYVPMDYDSNFPNPSPLPHQTVEFNALMSVYLTSANMQVGILKITRPEKQKISIASQSLYTAIEVPQSSKPEDKPSDIDFISPTPNMSGHREALTTYLTTILDEQGIASNQVITPNEQYSSGFDRLLAQADVQSLIEINQELFGRVEAKIYEIVATQMQTVLNDSTLPIGDDDDSFNIVYRKPKVMLSDNEKLQNLKLMKELGIWPDYELVQMYDPNLSVDEAKNKLQEIQQSKLEMASQFTQPPVADDTLNDGDE
jgi:hypothetical protein